MARKLAQAPTYARALTGNPNTESIRVYAADQQIPNRVWAQGIASALIGYSDDAGVNFTTKISNPDAGSGYYIQQLVFSPTYAWLLTGGLGSKQGRLHRSPLPDGSGNGLSWTLVFDLSSNGGAVGSSFRQSSFAVSEPYCYLVEYGASGGAVTGGPSVFRSSNNGSTWTKVKTFASAKHGHAVRVIGAVPWVSLGDIASTNADIGLWCATDAAAGTWGQRSIPSIYGGTILDVIDFIEVQMEGKSVIVGESDSHYGHGPLIFPSTALTSAMAIVPLSALRAPFFGSMLGLVHTFEGNLMWVTNSEGGAIGLFDAIWISPPPYSAAILLESLPPGTLSFCGQTVELGPYVFLDIYRVTKPRFKGQ